MAEAKSVGVLFGSINAELGLSVVKVTLLLINPSLINMCICKD